MNQEECQIFAKKLKQLRVSAGLTQEMLARLLNISRSCLANYESCNRMVNDEIVQDVAKYFDVSVAYLTGKESVFVPQENSHMREFSEILSKKTLDISNISSAARIALYEFYCFLTTQDGCKEGAERITLL